MRASTKLVLLLVWIVAGALIGYAAILEGGIANPRQTSPTASGSLDAPELWFPGDGEDYPATDLPVTLNWRTVAGATWYEVQVSADDDFTNVAFKKSGLRDSRYTVIEMLSEGAYYWRVRAGHDEGVGTWSRAWKFNVKNHTQPLSTTDRRPYTDDSPWNTPIGPSPEYDPYSQQMVETIGDSVTDGRIFTDTTRFSFTVYFADGNTPRHDMICRAFRCAVVVNGTTTYESVLRNVPIPDGAQPSAGGDEQMIIIDTATGHEYGFFHLEKTNEGWETRNGYRYNIHYNGVPSPFGARGAGVPYYAGLIRPWEIRRGEINHALAFAYSLPSRLKCVYPASKLSDGTDLLFGLPMGARLQLNPNLTEQDFHEWRLNRAGKIVARALQVYGMYVVDNSGSPKIYAEDLTNNPYSAESWDDADLIFTRDVIARIPFEEFRVLALPEAYWNPLATETHHGWCLTTP